MQLFKVFQTSMLWAMLLSIVVSTLYVRRCSCCGCCNKPQTTQGNSHPQPSKDAENQPTQERAKSPKKKSSGCPHCRSQVNDRPDPATPNSSSKSQSETRQPETPRPTIKSCCSCANEANGAAQTCPHGSLSQPDCQCEVTEQSGLVGVSSQVCEFARWLEVQWCSCLFSPDHLEQLPASHSLLTSLPSPEICSRGISAQILFSCWLI